MEQPEEQFAFALRYDDVTEYIQEELISAGYAPTNDELLDLGDIFMDLMTHILGNAGAEIVYVESLEDDEDATS